MAHLRDGSGWRGFLSWLNDVNAFDCREDPVVYERWLRQRKADRNIDTSAECQVSIVSAGAWQTDKTYVLFTHPDASLDKHAASALIDAAEKSGADVVYADEDQWGASGPFKPRFKPGFSIDLLRAEDYIGPVFLARSTTVQRLVGDVDQSNDRCNSYELLLLLAEAGAKFTHVSDVLVHWHSSRATVLSDTHRDLVEQHLVRTYGSDMGMELARDDPATIVSRSSLSIIIPTRDQLTLVSKCVESIYAASTHTDFEVILVDNRTQEPSAKAWLAQAPTRYDRLSVLEADYPFNWSKLNNQGARAATGDCLMFLNNDIEVITDYWLDRLSIQASRPDVGAVGPLLLYPNGTIQHAGVVVGIGGFADHVYAGCSPDADLSHVFVHPTLPRNVLVCTGACLTMSREKFNLVEGFNEALSICGDIDICARFHWNGLLNVFDPRVRLYHHESASRSRKPLEPEEIHGAMPAVAELIAEGDPYYSANLSLDCRYPSIAV